MTSYIARINGEATMIDPNADARTFFHDFPDFTDDEIVP